MSTANFDTLRNSLQCSGTLVFIACAATGTDSVANSPDRVANKVAFDKKTLSQLGSQFKVHPMQIAKWRKAALEQLPEVFVDGRSRKGRNEDVDRDALYEEIGRLKMELDWLEKKAGLLD